MAQPQKWKVKGGTQLSGFIKPQGSKNGALAILCACLHTHALVTLENVPRISDVLEMITVLRSISVQISWLDDNTITVQRPSSLNVPAVDVAAAEKSRATILLVPCLARDQEATTIPLPRGGQLGSCSLESHRWVLGPLGIQLGILGSFLRIRRTPRTSDSVVLFDSGDMVTESAILAAISQRGPGPIRIKKASCNYMVQDLCFFLQKLGAKIEGIGTTSLLVHPMPRPRSPEPVLYSVLEDPIEAFFFIAAAVVTNSDLQVRRVPIDFIMLELLLLQHMGVKLVMKFRYLASNKQTALCNVDVFRSDGKLCPPPGTLHPNVHPLGINPDNLLAFGPIAGMANGSTLFHDWMHEDRAAYLRLLEPFGIVVEQLDIHRVQITGPSELRAASIQLPPALRPASMALLAALSAPADSVLDGVAAIERGHENLPQRLRAIGADVLEML